MRRLADLIRALLKGGRSLSKPKRMELHIESLRKKGMKIGENVALYNVTFDGNFPFLIEIGSNCVITHATILTHDASPLIHAGKRVIAGRVIIGDNCFIGAGAIVLAGVKIGPNSIIGANAVVTRDIEANSVAVGNPARVVSRVDEWLAKKSVPDATKVWVESGFKLNVPESDELGSLIEKVKSLFRER
jgi:maltose O-acetyltransferase